MLLQNSNESHLARSPWTVWWRRCSGLGHRNLQNVPIVVFSHTGGRIRFVEEADVAVKVFGAPSCVFLALLQQAHDKGLAEMFSSKLDGKS